MRAFVAIPLPDHVIDALAPIRQAFTMGRVVPPENLHLTLAFLDNQPIAVLEVLHEALANIDMPEFPICFRGLDALGGKNPRLACALVENSAVLRSLRDKVRAAARVADLDLPRERFRPHITLARFRRDMAPDETLKLRDVLAGQGDVKLPSFQATAFHLIQSRLLPDGARYDAMAEYPLRAIAK